MVGGLDKQIKEIKEVIELPVKHPELFDALGINQAKGVFPWKDSSFPERLLGRFTLRSTRNGQNVTRARRRSSYGMYLYSCVGCGTRSKVHR